MNKQANNEQNFLHILNLDTIGGVEELFMSFLAEASTLSDARHHVLITGGLVHPFFKETLARFAASVHCEKYWKEIKIPKWLSFFRKVQKAKVIKAINPDKIILWNRFEDILEIKKNVGGQSSIIYYEHGASWVAKKDDAPQAFFTNVTTVIANSFAAKRLLELKWQLKNPVVVVDNPLRQDVLAQTNCKSLSCGIKLGYIGRLIPLKGVPLLLHTLKILLDRKIEATLKIAGAGEELSTLKKEAERLGISNLVEFIGIIRDVSSFYDSIDLLLVPSIREPLGLVAQEAAIRGCPVIASFVDGLPEVVQDNKTGYCLPPTLEVSRYVEFGGKIKTLPDLVYDPRNDCLSSPQILDPKLIADTIETIAKNPEQYTMLSRQAVAFATKRPTMKSYAKTLFSNFVMR